ncbi:hypothetical protein CUZ56_01816 [Saezia sanguinis]|uniref:DnaT DNA-binding domain-containing protein n=1 Tax=Saezia sanguinis TaxID=1965230 RepID=A0A433SCX9_9BURK|nr:hypothetical protein [Saezia sanguinis]RUS66536.1 hypothetical protein CUZ56_01816 [Saezia sanguinis]
MPNRILREGILTSERVNRLDWPSEVFYRRLLSVVDDYGRYFAHVSLLRAALFALRLDQVGNDDVAHWLEKTRQAGLVDLYEVNGKLYLQVWNFKQQARAKQSKFPSPFGADATDGAGGVAQQMHSRCVAPDAHRCSTGIADATVFEGEGVVGNGIGDATGDVIEDGGESAGGAGVPKVPACANKGRSAKGVIKQRQMLPEDFDLSSSSWAFAQERGVDVVVELQAFKDYHTAKGSTMLDWQAAWRAWCGNAVKFARASSGVQRFSAAGKQAVLEQRNGAVVARLIAQEEREAREVRETREVQEVQERAAVDGPCGASGKGRPA